MTEPLLQTDSGRTSAASDLSPMPFLIRGVLLKGLPLAAFFATVSLFPIALHNPVDQVGNPLGYLFVWTIIGAVLGYERWHAARSIKDNRLPTA
ncbi:MAG: hypothetical protein ACI9W4_001780 [Rhodothermales bacterium]|jgi:hypothetical protein